MKAGIKMTICMVMIAAAATMASMTIASFSEKDSQTADSAYVLGIAEGNVAVFEGGDLSVPLTVTEIEASSLRETDRTLLKEGVAVRTREELMALLEDLGS